MAISQLLTIDATLGNGTDAALLGQLVVHNTLCINYIHFGESKLIEVLYIRGGPGGGGGGGWGGGGGGGA